MFGAPPGVRSARVSHSEPHVLATLCTPVYDITRRETFENLSEVWMREVTMYSTVPDCVKLVVANKLDNESERQVTRGEGVAFARAHGCLFMEVSAKSRLGVQEAFAELVQRVRRAFALCAAAPADCAVSPPADCGVAGAACGVHRHGRTRAAGAERGRRLQLLVGVLAPRALR